MNSNTSTTRIILASQSMTRRKLLENAGVTFEAMASPLDEELAKKNFKGGTASELASYLATQKAQPLSRIHPGALVIGCDQTLSCNGQTLHKPRDDAQASEQLKALRGHTHELASAMSVARRGEILFQNLSMAQLTIRHFSDQYLEDYLASQPEAIRRSLGCYQLEGRGIQLFEQVTGDYFTILGLPLLPLLAFLRGIGELET